MPKKKSTYKRIKKLVKVYMKTLKIVGGALAGTIGLLQMIKTLVLFIQDIF